MDQFDDKSFSIIGYPKTGNTWIHHLIVEASGIEWDKIWHTHGMDSNNLNAVPFNEMTFDFSVHFFRKKLIILTRNLGDVLLSLYMHNKYREVHVMFDKQIDDIVNDPIYGASKYILFYQVVDDAIKNSNTEIMILRYEELLNDKSLIFNFMNFIEINDEAIITKAIENSTFKEMKKKESDDQYQVSALYRSINWQKTNDSFKVRNGINYDYVNHFSRENVEYIKIRMKEMPEIFGYKGYSFP